MSDELTYYQYIMLAAKERVANPELRKGQALMNTLYKVRPDVHEAIEILMGNNVFYSDSYLKVFLANVETLWDS